MKLKNNILQEDIAKLQYGLDTGNKQLNTALLKKDWELKDKRQPDTTVKEDLVCTYI